MKDYKKTSKHARPSHPKGKVVGQYASGGPVTSTGNSGRQRIELRNMMSAWRRAVKAGDYGPNFVREGGSHVRNHPMAAFMYMLWNNGQVKKAQK